MYSKLRNVTNLVAFKSQIEENYVSADFFFIYVNYKIIK